MAGSKDTFVVHQAKTSCSKGMRDSCVVLQVTHGVFLMGTPQITIRDCMSGSNVISFGGCYSTENPSTMLATEQMKLQVMAASPLDFAAKVAAYFAVPKVKKPGEGGPPQIAGVCAPVLMPGQFWDSGKEGVATSGAQPLMDGAKLHCMYGGEITIIDAGQPEFGSREAVEENTKQQEEKRLKLEQALGNAVDGYINIFQKIGTVCLNNNEEALDKVLEKDRLIRQVADKYEIDKELIQSVLFQEIRFYNAGDPVADSLVIQSYVYEELMDEYKELPWHKQLLRGAPQIPIGYRTDSSTGLGQIFAATAINATNSEEHTNYDIENWKDLKYFWYNLQDEDYNIDMVGKVLLSKKNELISKNKKDKDYEPAPEEIMRAYNGRGPLAEKYKSVTSQYYKAFKEYNQE